MLIGVRFTQADASDREEGRLPANRWLSASVATPTPDSSGSVLYCPRKNANYQPSVERRGEGGSGVCNTRCTSSATPGSPPPRDAKCSTASSTRSTKLASNGSSRSRLKSHLRASETHCLPRLPLCSRHPRGPRSRSIGAPGHPAHHSHRRAPPARHRNSGARLADGHHHARRPRLSANTNDVLGIGAQRHPPACPRRREDRPGTRPQARSPARHDRGEAPPFPEPDG